MVRLGIALGGGGAKGLAHVLILEALDELGVRPVCVAGTSIGAIVGVLYCSGRSGRELRESIGQMVLSQDASLATGRGPRRCDHGRFDWRRDAGRVCV